MTSSALRRLADVLAMHEALKYSRICSTTSFASPKVSWTEVPRPSSSSVALVCPRDEMTASERSTSSSARHSGSHSVPLGRRSMLFCIGIMATAAAAIELCGDTHGNVPWRQSVGVSAPRARSTLRSVGSKNSYCSRVDNPVESKILCFPLFMHGNHPATIRPTSSPMPAPSEEAYAHF